MMNYNFPTHTSGDTFDGVQFEMVLNEAPMDLTGVAIKLEIKKRNTSKALVTKTNGSGITITDAAAGEFRINAFDVDLEPGVYEYDVQLTFASGSKKTYIKGLWTITKQITD